MSRQDSRKKSKGEVRFSTETAERSSSEEEEEEDGGESGSQEDQPTIDIAPQAVMGPNRYLMKRPSYGDILQTLQQPGELGGNGFQQAQLNEGMSAIIAAARQQHETMAAAMANQQNPMHNPLHSQMQMQQVMAAQAAAAAAGGGPQFYPVPYPTGPVMMPQGPPHQHQHQQQLQTRMHKQEEVEIAKKERRLQKNREAAKECRRKKKEYVKGLEDRLRLVEQQNSSLSIENNKLRVRLGLPETAYIPPPALVNPDDIVGPTNQGSPSESS